MPVLSFQSKVSRHYHRAGHCDLPSLRARASRLTLGWQNTRYKNPQLVAQNCFGASFDQCFPFFTVRNQLDPQQKHLLQVEEMQRSDWLICQSASKFVACQVVSLMKNEQQSQNLLHKVDPRSTFRNNFLQPATNIFVVRQVDYAR